MNWMEQFLPSGQFKSETGSAPLDWSGHLLLLCGGVLLLYDALKVQDDEKKGITRYKAKCWGGAWGP